MSHHVRRPTPVPLVVLTLLAAASPVLAQERPDLQGSWVLSTEASDFGPTARPDSLLMTIERADDHLVMQRRIFMASRGIDVTYDFDMPIDGQAHEATSTAEPLEVTPAWEGDVLRLSTTAQSNVGPLGVVDRLRPGEAGTLVAEREVDAPSGTITSTMVFERRD